MRCLLKEHGLFSVYFANVDGDSLIIAHQYLQYVILPNSTTHQFLGSENRIHDGNVRCREIR